MAERIAPIDEYTRRDLAFLDRTKPVLVMGATGPAVIVIHEVYGFTPTLSRFCRWICDAGFRVYAPILFGSVDTSNPERMQPGRLLGLCVSREFYLFAAGKSSPIVEWLKALARFAHEECGGPGVGVIGMCLTGNFALAMAVEPVVLAPVVAQPGLPSHKPAALDVSAPDLADVRKRIKEEGFVVRGYRSTQEQRRTARLVAVADTTLGALIDLAPTLPADGHHNGPALIGREEGRADFAPFVSCGVSWYSTSAFGLLPFAKAAPVLEAKATLAATHATPCSQSRRDASA